MNELRVNGQTASEYGKAYAEPAIDALVTESPAIAEFTLRHLEEAVLACPNRTFGDDPDDSLVEFVTEATEAANDYLCKAYETR